MLNTLPEFRELAEERAIWEILARTGHQGRARRMNKSSSWPSSRSLRGWREAKAITRPLASREGALLVSIHSSGPARLRSARRVACALVTDVDVPEEIRILLAGPTLVLTPPDSKRGTKRRSVPPSPRNGRTRAAAVSRPACDGTADEAR